MKKKVGLALSGGGALGVAHIGVLQVFEENNIPIDIVTGTSMGSLVGGVYCAGVSTQAMQDRIMNFKTNRMLDVELFKGGIIAGKKVVEYLQQTLGEEVDFEIEHFTKPYAAIACDLVTGDKVVMDSGSLLDAIRASISVPGIFSPLKKDGKVLVDGGLIDNMPVEEARRLGADIVIGIDVNCFYHKRGNLNRVVSVSANSIARMLVTLAETKQDKGDIYIKVPQPAKVTPSSFTKECAKLSITSGRRAAEQALPQIKKLLGIK